MTDVDGIKLGLEMYQGGKEDAIKQVLEIIDEIDDDQEIKFGAMTYGDGKDELRRRVEALKGDEQE